MKKFFPLILFFPVLLFGQIRLPLATQTPPMGTSHSEMMSYLTNISTDSEIFEMEICGKSSQDFDIPAIFFPKRDSWSKDKTTAMIFAQQHGNEPSGKEALLMLIHEIYLNPQKYSFENLNLIFIPMVNPDGNESHKRRNGNNYDLNRNHVILTEPETQMLHNVFHKYRPQVTLDVHEYGFRTWLKLGYIKNFGEQLDCISNPAIPKELKNFAIKNILQPTINSTNERNVRANRYLITRGDFDYFVRHSTTDINDGRNGFGIQNTLSFILEGFNPLIKQEQIWQRARHQLTLIESFLKHCNEESIQIRKLVRSFRKHYQENPPDSIAIVADYTEKFSCELPIILKRTSDFRDTTIVLPDYRSKPEILVKIKRPDGYLIENPSGKIIDLVNNHNFAHKILSSPEIFRYEKFLITGRDTLDYESRDTIIPAGNFEPGRKSFANGSLLIFTNNSLANQIVQIFEAQSFYGLSHYEEYSFLIQDRQYPVYRIFFHNE